MHHVAVYNSTMIRFTFCHFGWAGWQCEGAGRGGQLFSEATRERRVLIPDLQGRPTFFSRVKKKTNPWNSFCCLFFFNYLDLSTVMDVPLTSASHCCELLMFWMDVRESQLIWRRKSVIGWGEKKIQASVKNKRNGSRTTMLFRLFYFFYLNVGIPFITTFWVFSVNNVSCWLSCLQWGHTGNMDVLKALWQTVAV